MSSARCCSITPLLLILVRKRYPSYPPTFTNRPRKKRRTRYVSSSSSSRPVPAPQAHFKVAEDAVKLSLEQEERVTTQINALLSMAKAESDYTADNFLQWFIKEQLEEVASMGQLLRVVQRASEGNLLRVEEFLAREKNSGFALSKEE